MVFYTTCYGQSARAHIKPSKPCCWLRRQHLLSLLLLLFLTASSLSAQVTWTGNTDSDWDTSTNWDGGLVPTAADDVIIPDVVTNDPIISATTTAVAKSVLIQLNAGLTLAAGATLTVNGGAPITQVGIELRGFSALSNSGSIFIDNTNGAGLYNAGTVNNYGTIAIGSTASIGGHGINNVMQFNNHQGEITIDRVISGGIRNLGLFYNATKLSIRGDDNNLGLRGLANQGSTALFHNDTGGEINIGKVSNDAVWNRLGAIFNNNAVLNIGLQTLALSVGGNGIHNDDAVFNNNAGGNITMDSIGLDGVLNTGTFTNKDSLKIGVAEGIYDDGIHNKATFVNDPDGVIVVLGVEDDGIFNDLLGNFTNKGEISVLFAFDNGLRNDDIFLNDMGGTLTIDAVLDDGIDNQPDGQFTNKGGINIGGAFGIFGDGVYNEGTFLNANGNLNVDATGLAGIAHIAGTFTNKAAIDIGNEEGTFEDGIYNDATFLNDTGGDIHIDDTGSNGIYNCSCSALAVFTNKGDIFIGSNWLIGADGIANESSFLNEASGYISIDDTEYDGIYNYLSGTFDNKGSVDIGADLPVSDNGIYNEETFTNHASGTVNIKDCFFENGVYNGEVGTFNNHGLLRIGDKLDVEIDDGIENENIFLNTGTIYADRCGDGIYNALGTFTNEGNIYLGSSAQLNDDGIHNEAAFVNENGTITIDRAEDNGMENRTGGIFTNRAALHIGGLAALASDGIENRSTFINKDNGDIQIDRVGAHGVNNFPSGTFTNQALVKIGTIGTIGQDGLRNNGTSLNDACATLILHDNFNNNNSFTNNGFFRVNTAQAHTNTGTAINNGVIEYPQGNPIPNVMNNDLIVAPVSGACTANNALQIGGGNSFTAASIWHNDPALTVQSGTYDAGTNAFTPTNLSGGNPHTLYFAVTDNVNACTRTVSIQLTFTDAVPPTITCPSNLVRSTDANLCTAVVNYPTPTYSDNCSGASAAPVPPSLPSGSPFPKGVTSVVWEVTDVAGLSQRCTFTITVNDTERPTISCPANQTRGTDPGQCQASVTYATPTAADNCSPAPTVIWISGGTPPAPHGPPNSTSVFPKGITTVQWKATDGVGLTKTCTFRVTVNDTEAPTIPTCAPSVNKNTDPGLCSAAVTYTNPMFTDNCTPSSGTTVRVSGLTSGSQFPVGVNQVVFRATDAAGLTRLCTMTVTVTDAQLPTITCPPPIVVTGSGSPCAATVNYATPTASDNCSVQSTFLLSGLVSGSLFPAGVTSSIWRAIDNSGQSATCAFTVTVSCGTGAGTIPATTLAAENGELETLNTQRIVHSSPIIQPLSLNLSPNPATTEVQVFAENVGENGGTLAVFDAQGHLLLQQPLTAEQPTVTLDISEKKLAVGLYFVTLRSEGAAVTKRLVVARQ